MNNSWEEVFHIDETITIGKIISFADGITRVSDFNGHGNYLFKSVTNFDEMNFGCSLPHKEGIYDHQWICF